MSSGLPIVIMAENNLLFNSERSRLETFVDFPHSKVDVKKFASAGFYFTGVEDEVCCAFCRMNLRLWHEGDDPMEEHKRYSKQCKFVNGLDVGNIPIGPEDQSAVPNQSKGVDECGLYGITPCNASKDVSLERLGICRRFNPAHPGYATLESRLQTFNSWPIGLKLRPQDLSEAGFYYTGNGDKTICFQCGGGLKDWNEHDDPWSEHAKYFQKCTYLVHKKGRDFVNQVLHRDQDLGNSTTEEPVSTTATIAKPAAETPMCDTDDTTLVVHSNQDVGSDSSGYNSASSSQGEPQPCSTETEKKIDDQRACKICYQEEMGVVFLPCGHIVACVNCAPSLKTCAVCRKPFSATVRAYLS